MREGYETRYDQRLAAWIRPGDCIWDIGANVGYYTRLFSERVTDAGKVFAFEPSPANFDRLVGECRSLRNVTFLRCGLGERDGSLQLRQGEDELGATSRITGEDSGDLPVEIRAANSLLVEGSVAAPNIVKIDVEGFEWEVLDGMSSLFANPCLRVVGIEIHFELLEERRMGHVPREIERLLRAFAFSVSWPDRSHVIGVRNA